MAKQKVLIIVGPTASGKSALGVELAKKFNGEIISADSRQVYKGLDIGTGKITKREMRGVPHHLLDVVSPKKKFSVADFRTHATLTVASIARKGKLPIIVGGTGYYIDAVTGRITVPDVPPNNKLRAELEKKSAAQLYALLGNRDPARARMMATPSERNNRRRLIRALEIADTLGKNPKSTERSPYDTLWIGINPPLKQIEKNISIRLFARIRSGMVNEARKLHAGGLSYKRMDELGLEYRSLARYLQNKISKRETLDELNRDIRRFAKKQRMYWKRNSEILWFASPQNRSMEKIIREWLAN